MNSDITKVGVVTIDVLSIGIKFEKFMQAGCRDQGLHRYRLQRILSSFVVISLQGSEKNFKMVTSNHLKA